MLAKLFAIGVILAGILPVLHQTAITTQPPVCHAGDKFMDWIIFHQRYNLRFYSPSPYWTRAGLANGDTSRIQPVTTDSLCHLATVTINKDMRVPATTARKMYLVTEGPLYLALDPAIIRGEFHTGFLLDSTLSVVIDHVAM